MDSGLYQKFWDLNPLVFTKNMLIKVGRTIVGVFLILLAVWGILFIAGYATGTVEKLFLR